MLAGRADSRAPWPNAVRQVAPELHSPLAARRPCAGRVQRRSARVLGRGRWKRCRQGSKWPGVVASHLAVADLAELAGAENHSRRNRRGRRRDARRSQCPGPASGCAGHGRARRKFVAASNSRVGSLKFSIGIERAVPINGNLVATNVLNLKDLQSSAGGAIGAWRRRRLPLQARWSSRTARRQIYVARRVAPCRTRRRRSSRTPLNDQKIQAVTTINAPASTACRRCARCPFANAIQYGIVSSLRR